MHPLINIAIHAARQAGDILLRHMEKIDQLKIITKGARNYCSEADIKAEEAIIKTILKAYPDHGIFAEESGEYQKTATTIWIIDPLDGTTNYLHGFPMWSVSIAITVKNRLEHAVILDPLRQECFIASRGQGAQLNDRRLRVSKQRELQHALIGNAFVPHDAEEKAAYLRQFQSLSSEVAGLRRTGSAALDLAYVAAGRLDGFLGHHLKPWDIAAGALLVQEAGGFITDTTGGDHWLKTGDLIAATPKLFKAMFQQITKPA